MQTFTNDTTESAPPATLSVPPPFPFPRRRRFIRIFLFFMRIIVHVYIFDILLKRFRLTRWYAQRTALRRWQTIARRFRGLAVQMGGVLIKLGQFMSSRADVLPAAITDELAGLQDEVPAAPLPYILAMIQAELGAPPDAIFAHFDPRPVAAASFGQVYFGSLRDGREVAIKVQRPRIDEIVEIDLRVTLIAIRIIKNYPIIKRRADMEALFAEFARVLRQELDYVAEADNARAFRANFANTPGVYFPEPYSDYSTRRVLVMERISGFKVTDAAAIEAAQISRADLAVRLNNAYMKQFYFDGIFHADPHPGNLFVRPEGPPPPHTNGAQPHAPFTLIFVDSGMVGHLTPAAMSGLREGVIGIATNDAARIMESLEKLNMLLPGVDRQPLQRAVQILLRYGYDRSVRELNNMDVDKIFGEIEHLVRDLPFQLPQDLIYLGRATSMVGGLTTTIDPDFNLFNAARPFATQLIAGEKQEEDLSTRIRRELTSYAQIAVTLPRQMDAYFKAANRGDLEMRVDLTRLERSMRRVERATTRLASGIAATGLFVGGVLLRINGFASDASWAIAAAALLLLWTLWPRGER